MMSGLLRRKAGDETGHAFAVVVELLEQVDAFAFQLKQLTASGGVAEQSLLQRPVRGIRLLLYEGFHLPDLVGQCRVIGSQGA